MRIRVLGQYVHGSLAVLAAVDAILFFGVLILAAMLRLGTNLTEIQHDLGPLWPRAILFSAVMFVSLLSLGLYSARQRARRTGILVRVLTAVLAGTAVTAVCYYLLPEVLLGRGVLALAAPGAFISATLTRTAFSRFVDENIFKRRVLIYGAGQRASSIVRLRRRADRRGFVVVGFVAVDGEKPEAPAEQLLPTQNGLRYLCRQHDVDEVVVAMDDRRSGFPILELLEVRLAGSEVTELLSFLERETCRVRIDLLNPSWMIFGEGFRRDSVRLFSSRALDLLASSLICVVSLPVLLLTTLAIKLEDGIRAPVLYKQARVGLGGRDFNVLKFRSMRIDAERDGQAQWAQKQDPRVTWVGAIIRKLRIDELPQILNVLRGDMSFVGPRPERPQFVAELAQKIPYYVQRQCVKPGITGWAQLCYPYGSSEQDALEKLQYDLYYIKNNSLLFDISILMQTVEVVIMGQGAR